MGIKKWALAIINCCLIVGLSAQIYAPKKLKGKAGKYLKNMMYIPGDTMFTDDHLYTKSSTVKPVVKAVVKQFYMCMYEASFDDWRLFYNAMVAKQGKIAAAQYIPDSTCWNIFPLQYGEPFYRMNYFKHPAYGQYPVVGITHNQVQEYIQWKNIQMDSLLTAQGITGYDIIFRLPTAVEMEYVMQRIHNPGYGLLGQRGYLANFGSVIDTSGYIFKYPDDDGYEIIAPIRSFNSNYFGIFNVQGNVEEWTSDTYTSTANHFDYDGWLSIHAIETDTTRYICKGGSWFDSPFYLTKETYKAYPANAATAFTGFRLVMDVVPVATSKQN